MKKSQKHSHTGSALSKSASSSKKEPTLEVKEVVDDDEEYNSGFGNYLRSAEGIEMMKLFVVANSVLVILTMAWPSMKEAIELVKEMIYGDEEE